MKALLFVINSYARAKYSLFLILALLPMFLLVQEDYPDWGDDFAQYIYQSQHLTDNSNSYKHVLNVSEFSSPKRSLFFSVVLSFVLPTLTILPYLNLITVLYILAAICCFLFFTKFFSFQISFASVLAIFYNYLLIRLKGEVLTEFLFISLFYLTLFLIISNKSKLKYHIPILIALLLSVRFVGFVMLLAYLINDVIWVKEDFKLKAKKWLIDLLIIAGALLFVNFIFINTLPNKELDLYTAYTSGQVSIDTIWFNIKTYSSYILYYFEQEIPWYLNDVIKYSVIILFCIGLIDAFRQRLQITEIVFIAYLIVLFGFPNSSDTIRYLAPIFPLCIYYVVRGMLFPINFLANYIQYQFAILFLLGLMFSNINTIRLSVINKKEKLNPYSVSVKNDFIKIKQITKQKDIVAFTKPFLMNLFCDRNSYYLTNQNQNFVLSKANYVLLPKQEITELYSKTNQVLIIKGDTTRLNHFYLIKL